MTISPIYSVCTVQNTAELTNAHTSLRSELATIKHWRRLIKARIDLYAAQVVTPFPLGGSVSEFFDSSDLLGSKEVIDLPAQVLEGLPRFSVNSLLKLKEYEVTLSQYERGISAKFMELSDELAQRHAHSRKNVER